MIARRSLVMAMLIALALMPALILSASASDEYDHFAFLPVIRAGGEPVNTWAMAYGYEDGISHSAGTVVESDDGGFVYCGAWHDYEATSDPGDIVVTKVDASGEIVWQKWYDGIHYDNCAGLGKAAGGKLFVAGSTSNGEWFAKLDHDGTIIWQKLFLGDSNFLRIAAFQATTDGGFVVAGEEVEPGYDLWVAKFDGDGNLQWLKKYGNVTVLSAAIEEDGEGGYFVGGTWWSETAGQLDSHILHLDRDGKIVWQKAIGESDLEEFVFRMGVAADHGIFISSLTVDEDYKPNFWVMKLRADGSLQWHKKVLGEWDVIDLVRATPDGGCILAGTTADGDISLLKMNSNGAAIWQRFYRGTEWDSPAGLLPVSSGGFLLTGNTKSYGSGDSNAWLLRLDKSGNIDDCSIDETGDPALEDFSLPVLEPNITATAYIGAVSPGDLVISNSTAQRTVVCGAARANGSLANENCQ